MNPNFTIQAATLQDASELARIHIDVWRSTYRGIIPDAYLDSLDYNQRTKMWTHILTNITPELQNHVLVAKDPNQKAVGFVAGGRIRDAVESYDSEVYAINVLKEFQQQGLGKELLKKSLEQLTLQGFSKAMLWVLKANPSIKFYEAMGGVKISERLDEIGGKNLEEFAYGWTLTK